MAEGSYSNIGHNQRGGVSTFDSGLHEYSLRPGSSFQNIVDWSFDDDIDASFILEDKPDWDGSASSSSGRESAAHSTDTSTSQAEKKIQFPPNSDKLPSYKLHKNSMCKVNFPGKTWNIMMQGSRIALESDNVFICDHFLGKEGALTLLQELWYLRNTGEFNQHMRRGTNYDYSPVYLLEQNKKHRQLDALVLMIYKLALYYTDEWSKVTVELCYYPDGHTIRTVSTDEHQSKRKLLKCVYFPDDDWTPVEKDQESSGIVKIITPKRVTNVEPIMDRLVVFWGDTLEHSYYQYPKERITVTILIER